MLKRLAEFLRQMLLFQNESISIVLIYYGQQIHQRKLCMYVLQFIKMNQQKVDVISKNCPLNFMLLALFLSPKVLSKNMEFLKHNFPNSTKSILKLMDQSYFKNFVEHSKIFPENDNRYRAGSQLKKSDVLESKQDFFISSNQAKIHSLSDFLPISLTNSRHWNTFVVIVFTLII